MKKMWIFIALFLFIGFLLILPFATASNPAPAQRPEKKKPYDKLQLLEYLTEERYLPTREQAVRQYKICPPLRPERFHRKVKMLWGVDINDYPENSVIRISSIYTVSKKYQLIQGGNLGYGSTDEIPSAPPLTDDMRSLCRQYLFFADTSVLDRLAENKYAYTKEILKLDKRYLDYEEDIRYDYDIVSQMYRGIIMTPISMFRYRDKTNAETGYTGAERLNNIVHIETLVFDRAFDMKSDLLSLYIREQCKTRELIIGGYNKEQKKKDVLLSWNGMDLTDFSTEYVEDLYMHFPWHNYNLVRSFAGHLSFLIQLQRKETNSYIIKYMTGQLDAFDTHSYNRKERQDSIRNQIRTNNYYGYAILREFCENPEREMPTLEKVGTSFHAAVVNPNTLLYLEPYPDSYDIDTIQPAESFKAYEMGYDDYYLVEVMKPVESPVAGPDGYAMILDRTEIIYGYIRKSAVKEISEIEKISKQIIIQSTRKMGKIDDPDGYVNIRKESNTESEITGKIMDKELFFYREIPDSNWWYVESKDNIRGFVHKSRIREKIDAGSWILDE